MTADSTRGYPDDVAGPFETPPRSFEDAEGRTIGMVVADETDHADLVEMYEAFDSADRAQGIPPRGSEAIDRWVGDLLTEGYNVVARHDGAVVGHGTLVPDGDEACELAIFVLSSHQGAGIGTALIRTLLGHGAEEGVDRVWLTVEPWNNPAIAVYESVGFERCGTGSFERQYSIRLG